MNKIYIHYGSNLYTGPDSNNSSMNRGDEK